jgi:hypothetical protein
MTGLHLWSAYAQGAHMPRARWSADLWESASYDDQSYKRGCGKARGSRGLTAEVAEVGTGEP